ncbi:MAG: DUF3040 domain-containing protein [Actinomycetales bacterium]|mgnify:FL=1|jgi:hypothetical protein|nr:DUF3040 domain-containing protein [Actinomycetales bacterium]
MPLSEYEQRVLEQMERQLTTDDPKLVSTLRGGRSTLGRWLLTGIGALAGLTLLVVGTAASLPIVGIAGFVLMFVFVVLALTPPRRRGPAGTVQPDGSVRRPAQQPRSKGFVERLEERWERRRDEGRG